MTAAAKRSVEARLKAAEEQRKRVEEKLAEAERQNKNLQGNKTRAVSAVEQQVRVYTHTRTSSQCNVT